MHDIFLSYSRIDTDTMQRVKQSFKDADLTVWTDEGIQPGTPSWTEAIENAIGNTQVLVCICSPDAKKSRWVKEEVSHAEMRQKTVYLILARGDKLSSIPFGYSYHQYTDIRNRHDYDNAISRLIARIKDEIGMSVQDSAPNPSKTLSQSIVPQTAKDQLSILKVEVMDDNSPSSPTASDLTDEVKKAIQLAQNFKGRKNSDWSPVIETFEVKGMSLEMCLVPVGSFIMGSEGGQNDEKPIHIQTISEPYWIGLHPVTNAQWRQAVENSGGVVKIPDWADWYNDDSKANHPVVGVTWYQCQDFIKWLGNEWHLPTEKQWEFAARGFDNLVYPFGNKFQPDLVVYAKNSNGSTAGVGGRSRGTAWVGVQDMSGNVWEWTSSIYKDYPYYSDDRIIDNSYCVLRGGSCSSSAKTLKMAYRGNSLPKSSIRNLGFRLVHSLSL